MLGNMERSEIIKARRQEAYATYQKFFFEEVLKTPKSGEFWTTDIRELAQAAGNSIKKAFKG